LSLELFAQRIRDAAGAGSALRPRGGGSKDFYGNAPRGEILDTRAHAGIVNYEPSELFITARCGTPLSEVENALAASGQMLAFEPPHFGAATFGGCVAAGLSGPRRAAAGALRDFVLGVTVIDGRSRVLAFGGQVMKNVAGYDISRLIAGSLGTLGVITEATFKVLPRPQSEATLRLEMAQERALEVLNRWAGEPLPLSASAWHEGELYLRLSGSGTAVSAAAKRIGGDAVPTNDLWREIREQTHAFFSGDEPLWRIALPSTTPPLGVAGRELIEWGGGLRWLKSSASGIREAAQRVKGHATLFRGGDKSAGVFTPLEPTVARLHRSLKAAFDPAHVFNPGRLYADF
jgi:glycolate dehydrogenase FAD-binding subunit